MRHLSRMRALPLLALLLTLPLWADEASDRAAIAKTIAAFNNRDSPPSTVWAPGVDGAEERAKLTGGPMSEVGAGRISIVAIQFPARRTAFVSATQTQFGSLFGVRSISLGIKMKRLRRGWRITEILPRQ